MALQRLPPSVQDVFCASLCINNFSKAVEELVYNSLDASATSIAIRYQFDENFIQILDNGCGISKCDMQHVGQKYMTSKTIDLASLKSIPSSYGFRGQALASIIVVSYIVKITSRVDTSNETLTKLFCDGKEKDISYSTPRPSKGTTVEIQGFLHNLTMQRKAINRFNEIQKIKQFLKRLSLVHSNISISLRDNSNNDIVFHIHKSRDIYQTLNTIFGMKSADIQELQVEKKFYKVIAYFGKKVSEDVQPHWLYLNGRFLPSCRLHKIVDDNVTKLLGLKRNTTENTKLKNIYTVGEQIFENKVLFYLIYITCPYNDYNINYSSSVDLEFKNWNEISKILEKVVTFYISPFNKNLINLKRKTNDTEQLHDTREKVKKIMERILASNSKKLDVSQMQNGVKGKQINRKKKRKIRPEIDLIKPVGDNKKKEANCVAKSFSRVGDKCADKLLTPLKNNIPIFSKEPSEVVDRGCISPLMKRKNVQNTQPTKKSKQVKKRIMSNVLLNNFQHASDTVKDRCAELENKVIYLLQYKRNQREIKESSLNDTIQKRNINIPIKKKVGEINNHDIKPMPPEFDYKNHRSTRNQCYISSCDLLQTILKSQAISKTREKQNVYATPSPSCYRDCTGNNYKSCEPRLTYESHLNHIIYTRYPKRHIKNVDSRSRHNCHFITRQSRDQLTTIKSRKYTHKRKCGVNKQRPTKQAKQSMLHYVHSEQYSIEYTDSLENKTSFYNCFRSERDTQFDMQNKLNSSQLQLVNKKNITYSIDGNDLSNLVSSVFFNGTYTLRKASVQSQSIHRETDNANQMSADTFLKKSNEFYFVNKYERVCNKLFENVNSHAQAISKHEQMGIYTENKFSLSNNSPDKYIDPLTVCETILSSHDVVDDDVNNCESNKTSEDSPKQNSIEMHLLSLPSDAMATCNEVEEKSYHFSDIEEKKSTCFEDKPHGSITAIAQLPATNNSNFQNSAMQSFCKGGITFHLHKNTGMTFNNNTEGGKNSDYSINFRGRPRFMPKGMSPIFNNCNTKVPCDYKQDEDYFNNSMYKKFVKAVETNAEIFEAHVEKVNNFTTDELNKLQSRIDKDNASLSFNRELLKHAKVLGQVDCKFIAAKIKGNKNDNSDSIEYLVLFDQHAVHERIRLEKNLTEYFINDQWRSVSLDSIKIKLKQDQILYLHNYKEKFTQLGLKWVDTSNTEILVKAIPEAIIGKHYRQVELIMKAVKNLILEEVDVLRSQKGSISLYPKSIMDLVFSEACRYAIKFGEKLSHIDCAELLSSLSNCKTPFQCAHGRPVMAVLLDIKPKSTDYKVDLAKIIHFNKRISKA